MSTNILNNINILFKTIVKNVSTLESAKFLKIHILQSLSIIPVSYTHLDVYKRQT